MAIKDLSVFICLCNKTVIASLCSNNEQMVELQPTVHSQSDSEAVGLRNEMKDTEHKEAQPFN